MKKTQSTRRTFLKTSATLAAMPLIVPSTVFGQNAPSNKLIVGCIGIGSRGDDLMNQLLRRDDVRIAALADCDRPFLLRARQIVEDLYDVDRVGPVKESWKVLPSKQPAGAVDAYNDYRYIIDRMDIDAVVSAVPDHWHAKVYIDAMDAGKDVYGEKPIALTHSQGRHIARKVEETGRIFQTGSQQRSDAKFRKACETIRNGMLGKIKHIDLAIGGAPQIPGVPDAPIPPGLDWNQWLGPAPYVPYNEKRVHLTFRWFYDYSGGQVTDWGAHHCDICQWALGMDESGPRFVEGWAKTKQPGYYETFTSFEFQFTYANGITVKLHSKGNMCTFYGEKGTLKVNRGFLECDPASILEQDLPANATRLYKSDDHMSNFLDCIKTREQPICTAEIGHRSLTLSHIANICGKLGRKLEWDPVKERFIHDQEANTHLQCEERAPFHHMAGV
jgi:predicted dehydrogenase